MFKVLRSKALSPVLIHLYAESSVIRNSLIIAWSGNFNLPRDAIAPITMNQSIENNLPKNICLSGVSENLGIKKLQKNISSLYGLEKSEEM
jgi:hypothetical protein